MEQETVEYVYTASSAAKKPGQHNCNVCCTDQIHDFDASLGSRSVQDRQPSNSAEKVTNCVTQDEAHTATDYTTLAPLDLN